MAGIIETGTDYRDMGQFGMLREQAIKSKRDIASEKLGLEAKIAKVSDIQSNIGSVVDMALSAVSFGLIHLPSQKNKDDSMRDQDKAQVESGLDF